MRRYIDIGERDGYRFQVGRSKRITRALSAGHITGREAGRLHRLAAFVVRARHLQ